MEPINHNTSSNRMNLKRNPTLKNKSSIMKSHTLIDTCSRIFLLLLCAKQLQSTLASGVFELELMDFQRFDQPSPSARLRTTATTSKDTITSQNISSPIRLVICLKEAFASQLDGPCTFGNASITLGDQQIATQRHHTSLPTTSTLTTVASNAATNTTTMTNVSEEQQSKTITTAATAQAGQQISGEILRNNQPEGVSTGPSSATREQELQQGSLLTNVVRIQFTFRWTVSNCLSVFSSYTSRPAPTDIFLPNFEELSEHTHSM